MRRTQNCGVVVNSSITSYATARDSNPVKGNVEYYELLTDIIELDYYGKWKVVLFRCDWADVNTARRIKKDQFGFTMVNFSRLIHTGQQLMDEPYNTPNSEEANSEQQTVVGSSNVPETLDEPEEFQRSRSFASVAEAEEVKSGQKVGHLQLFEITHRKKDGSPMTSEAGEIMEKLKEKKAEYEAIASTDSSVNLENIDNRIIIEVLGPERYGQIAQMQANTVEQIAKVQRKYEELQQQLRAERGRQWQQRRRQRQQ
ncbi:hypothetical protein PVK06_048237 [Gossypium arboreum]|uniref:DUF4216 domain-containing protein n=1 Tax=Gossypium arboreum TaxID=29729 RepID=A0ABR0MFG4_GOSAR|nr:hypothetical protein PVK06_048237 [Gossypium arboreum]